MPAAAYRPGSVFLACRLARRPVRFLTTFHGVYSHGNALKRFYNSAMLRVPLVIANSQFIRDHIVAVYGFPLERVIVAPRGVEPDLFDPVRIPAETRSALRRELGATESGPLVVMVGRVTRCGRAMPFYWRPPHASTVPTFASPSSAAARGARCRAAARHGTPRRP